MKPVIEHAKNIHELVMAYLDDEIEEHLCDYIEALRREAWIEAKSKKDAKLERLKEMLHNLYKNKLELDKLYIQIPQYHKEMKGWEP